MSIAFKTASQLGITEMEHQALILTIDVLKNDQIVFDMETACSVGVSTSQSTTPCGTNLCIGGTMSILMQNDRHLPRKITTEMGGIARRYVMERDAREELNGEIRRVPSTLSPLFFDNTESGTKPEDGIVAIRRFLEGNTTSPWGFDYSTSDDEGEDDDW